MKQFLLFVLCLSLLTGCSSSKLLEKGRYDAAIRKSTKKLKRKPDKMKEIYVLEEAYNKANNRDREKINRLREEGKPENFDKIYAIYKKMDDRQNVVKPLPPLGIDFDFKDYSDEMGSAKKNAADYAYANGLILLEKGDRENARKAHAEFVKVKGYYNDYEDVDEKIKEAKSMGTTNVVFKIENNSGIAIPGKYKRKIKRINLDKLDKEWVDYHKTETQSMSFDYHINFNINTIEISPDNIEEKEFSESRKVEDGWEYVLDENGNVKKDTSGNDIKRTKYKTITCKVIESTQKKSVHLSGTLDYVQVSDGDVIKSEPISVDESFEHTSATAVGNEEALSAPNLKKIKSEPVNFPTDDEMIMKTGNAIKILTKDLLHKNKNLLK